MRQHQADPSLVDLIISNDRHHWALAKPLSSMLITRGFRCRVISLCELRGLETPADLQAMPAVSVRRIMPMRRPRAASSAILPRHEGMITKLAHGAVWH